LRLFPRPFIALARSILANRLGPTRNRSDGLSQSWPVSALSGCTCRQSLRLILSSKLGRGPGRMTPFSNHHDRPGAGPGFSLTLGENCVNSGRRGTAGPGPPDSPIRPSRSPTGPQADGTTAKAHSPRAAVGRPWPSRARPSPPVQSGFTASAWGSTAICLSSGLPWTRSAIPSVSRGNNSAIQEALAIRVLRPARAGRPAYLSPPFRSVRDPDPPLGRLRELPLGDPSLSRQPPVPSPPNEPWV
jgi:hypothetical protein